MFNITHCYGSPSVNSIDFIEDLNSFFEHPVEGSVKILIGDFNFDILNNISNTYVTTLMSHGCESYINRYTKGYT